LAQLGWVNPLGYQDASRLTANGKPEASMGLQQAMVLEAWLTSDLPLRLIRGLSNKPNGEFPMGSSRPARQILRKEVQTT